MPGTGDRSGVVHTELPVWWTAACLPVTLTAVTQNISQSNKTDTFPSTSSVDNSTEMTGKFSFHEKIVQVTLALPFALLVP